MQVDKVSVFNNTINSMINFSSKTTKDFKSVLNNTNKPLKSNNNSVSKSNNTFKQNNSINKTTHKINKPKDSNENDDLKDKNIEKDDINKVAEEKLEKISDLLNSEDITTNTAKQDELLKLFIQLQSLIENQDFTPEQNVMDKINEVLNSSVLDSVKQQDSLMKDITTQIQTDSKNLSVSSLETDKTVLNQNGNIDSAPKESSVDDKSLEQSGTDSNVLKDTANKKLESSNVVDKESKTVVINDKKTTNNDSEEKVIDKLSLREAYKEKQTIRQKAKENNENYNVISNAEDNNDQVSGQNSITVTAKNNENAKEILLNNKTAAVIKASVNKESFDEASNNMGSNTVKSDLASSLKDKLSQTTESIEVNPKTITAKQAFEEFKQNQENSDNSNSQANLQANIKADNQNILIRNNFNLKTAAPSVNYKDILEQIKTGTKVVVSEDTTEMTIKLNPENLGKLSLKLVTENGIVSAKFVAESQHVKEIIESNFNELKQSFANQGLNIGNLSVSVGSDSDGLRRQLYNSSNGKRKISNSLADNTTFDINEYEEEKTTTNNSNNAYPESSVNYIV